MIPLYYAEYRRLPTVGLLPTSRASSTVLLLGTEALYILLRRSLQLKPFNSLVIQVIGVLVLEHLRFVDQ